MKISPPARNLEDRNAACLAALRGHYKQLAFTSSRDPDGHLWPLKAEAVLAGWHPEDVDSAIAILKQEG